MIHPLLEFTVFGKSEPAGSKKAVPQGPRWGVVDANPNAAEWKARVADAAGEHWRPEPPAGGADDWDGLLTGPLAVEFVFTVTRPKTQMGTGRNEGTVRRSAPLYPATRPDVLKLARGVEDALTGVVWRDDAQIVDERLRKVYGAPARCEIRVWRPAGVETLDPVELPGVAA